MSELSFEHYAIREPIQKALRDLGYTQPTAVQDEVIPQLLDQKDLVVKSQTGSGKTAAYGIPLCELVEWEENKPQALVLTPTRELAVQVKEDLMNIGRYERIKVAAVFGKHPFAFQKQELKQKNHIVAGTPGRVLDHIQKGSLALNKIRFLIIDEADEMLNMGFIEQVEAIIKELPTERVTVLLSATLPEDVDALSSKYMKNPILIEAESSGQPEPDITHLRIAAKEEDKPRVLANLLITKNPDSCVIFCRTQERVNQVFRQLVDLSYPCDRIHGGMEQEERFEVMNAFRRGQFRYLVATDVAARGIDVEHMTHVINYDVPQDAESYVHRAGRTGRAGKSGEAITLVSPQELKYLDSIESYTGRAFQLEEAPTQQEVLQAKFEFDQKIHARHVQKVLKSDQLSQDIIKLYFNGGKKKKLRAVDFVGTIARIEGVEAGDIGIITIQDTTTYVEILNGKGMQVLQAMKDTTIKGKQLKVHIANK
ncbi:superfamily II DNA/RNA helicase [Paenibacillus shirakamiensis]|uniref:ATP-dependent RNA helicase DbpA n=1 Tax=Paenibacillus shirakamiensis TaxID=1265935 RepID=A0ABS4JJU0_9BACL|nr:DEAD/DEAH box helicase [Paenibacillus shirakamiensis]MBP2001981.1 superfamily II DNA/RNA helicase [Paenibacillus shirakamiensis]